VIAVDTNVLVRYLTNDDQEQAKRALAFLGSADTVLVTETVLLELEWVLRGAYRLPRETIHRAMLQVLGLENVQVRQATRIARVLDWFAAGMDLADAMHLALADEAEGFVTFDRRLVKRASAEGLAVALL
jgi:predicted nucleic-acid-binding protein